MNYKTIKGSTGCQISFCYQNNVGGWEQRKCYLSFSTSALLPLDQFDLLLFELFFACLVSLKKITMLSCWELLQLRGFISSDSFSFHVVLHLPITMMLYDHFPGAPSCTPTSSVFPEGLDSYIKDIVSCVNCTSLSHSPPLHLSVQFPPLSQRKSHLCAFQRLTLPSILKISIPLHHLKTRFSIIPRFCTFNLSLSTHSFFSTNKHFQVSLIPKLISPFLIFL